MSKETSSDQHFDVEEADRLLSTTRAVRKRLDFDRDVPDQIILDAIDVAEQAPSGAGIASRRWIVVRDPELKQKLGAIYKRSGSLLVRGVDRSDGTEHDQKRVLSSGRYLVENFAKAPVLVVAAIWGEHDNSGRPGLFDSVVPSAWSFNLALRARGLGSAYTTLLNSNVDELAEILGIPAGVTTVVTFPVAYTRGTNFKKAKRRPATDITYFDQWGYTRESASKDGLARIVDGPGVVAEIDINASRADLWALVSDISLPARFSHEFEGADWDSDERGIGATFTGRNRSGDKTWEEGCHVLANTENETFGWGTGQPSNPGATWQFELDEIGSQTRLRFAAKIGNTDYGIAARAQADPEGEPAVINARRATFKANMQATIEGIKVLAEGKAHG